MQKIAVIADSSCDLPKEWIKQHNIHTLPLRIIYKDKEFRDRVEITPEEIYERFHEEIPTSSLPLPEDAQKLLEKLIAEGYTHILAVTISSGLSGTYNMLRNVVSDIEGPVIELIDSRSLSMGAGFLVMEAVDEIERSGDFNKAVQKAREAIAGTETYYVIKTLEYLRKGGRIGKVEGTIGDLLNIKPIISVGEDGAYFTFRKVRGRKKSINELYTIAQEHLRKQKMRVAVMHGNAPKEAEALANKLQAMDHVQELLVEQISPVLAVHTGPGLVGVIVSPINEA